MEELIGLEITKIKLQQVELEININNNISKQSGWIRILDLIENGPYNLYCTFYYSNLIDLLYLSYCFGFYFCGYVCI